MPTTARLSGAELSFHADRVDVPIGRITAEMSAESGGGLERPAIVAPQVADELEIRPLRELALREILRHAHSGKARVHVKLPARSFKVGPLALELKEGHEAIIEVEVEAARIKRRETRGTVEPPLPLPLGMELRTIYLNDDGDVVIDISGLPDINLSQLTSRVPRIPATLDGVLEMLLGDDDSDDSDDDDDDDDPGVDPASIYVEARDVVPRSEMLDLGDLGELVMGPETRLDVDFRGDAIRMRGRVHVLDARLHGTGFSIAGLAGKGTLNWDLEGLEKLRETTIDLTIFEGRSAQADLALRDGSNVHLGPATLGRSTARLVRVGRETRFSIELGRVAGALESANVKALIGENVTDIQFLPTAVTGSASLSDRHVEVDLQVADAEVTARDVKLFLGVAELELAAARARATGHLKAGTDFGAAFSGNLAIASEVRGGAAHLGGMKARLDPGSEAVLHVTEIAAGEDSLDALVAEGELKLRFHSGQLPLGPAGAVSFSKGATGGVTLSSVEIRPGEKWPRVRGHAHVEARADPLVLESLVEVPSGQAEANARFRLDEQGHLIVQDLEMTLRSLEDG